MTTLIPQSQPCASCVWDCSAVLPPPARYSQRVPGSAVTASKASKPAPPNLTWSIIVRQATEQFVDVNAATAAGYEPAFGCVTGPDMGAMGVHYINNALVSGGELNANQPQALIYEPAGKAMKLVGVEYITLAENWLTAHQQAPPILEGQLLQYIGAPNRYGLPGLFEPRAPCLAVRGADNFQHRAYVDWNTHVTCDKLK